MDDEMVVKNLTVREMVYNVLDGTWNEKIDPTRSEAGSFISAAVGTGTITSGITKTRLLTGLGTLASAGMKFHLKEVVVAGPKAGALYLWDGTACTAAAGKCKLRIQLATQTVAGGNLCVQAKDIHGAVFSSAVRYKVTTGMAVHIGGLVEVILA